jgi:prophage tail gpP-like protein
VKIEVDGNVLSGFVESEVTASLDDGARTFTFTAATDSVEDIGLRSGQACRVFVDDERILTGFIEVLAVQGEGGENEVSYTGRDKVADLIDSTIGPLSDLKPPLSLAQLCGAVISQIGADIDVVDRTGGQLKLFEAASDLPSPESGVTAFDFIEKMCRKRQAIASSTSFGNLLLFRGEGIGSGGGVLVNRVRGADNNLISYEASFDQTGRFNLYRSVGQSNLLALSNTGGVTAGQVVNRKGQISDGEIRAGRQMALVSEGSFGSTDGEARATWERNVRRARGRRYSATVAGYRNSAGNVWEIGTLADVDCQFSGIQAEMMIAKTTFSLTTDGGSRTTLELVEKNAYTLEVGEPAAEVFTLG